MFYKLHIRTIRVPSINYYYVPYIESNRSRHGALHSRYMGTCELYVFHNFESYAWKRFTTTRWNSLYNIDFVGCQPKSEIPMVTRYLSKFTKDPICRYDKFFDHVTEILFSRDNEKWKGTIIATATNIVCTLYEILYTSNVIYLRRNGDNNHSSFVFCCSFFFLNIQRQNGFIIKDTSRSEYNELVKM